MEQESKKSLEETAQNADEGTTSFLTTGTLRKISGIRKFGQKILSKMREHVHRTFQDPHFSHVTASQKSGITILAMHLRF